MPLPLAAKEAGVTDQTYYRWRKEYGGLQLEQAKKLKDLQEENAQLKRTLATLGRKVPVVGGGIGLVSDGLATFQVGRYAAKELRSRASSLQQRDGS